MVLGQRGAGARARAVGVSEIGQPALRVVAKAGRGHRLRSGQIGEAGDRGGLIVGVVAEIDPLGRDAVSCGEPRRTATRGTALLDAGDLLVRIVEVGVGEIAHPAGGVAFRS